MARPTYSALHARAGIAPTSSRSLIYHARFFDRRDGLKMTGPVYGECLSYK